MGSLLGCSKAQHTFLLRIPPFPHRCGVGPSLLVHAGSILPTLALLGTSHNRYHMRRGNSVVFAILRFFFCTVPWSSSFENCLRSNFEERTYEPMLSYLWVMGMRFEQLSWGLHSFHNGSGTSWSQWDRALINNCGCGQREYFACFEPVADDERDFDDKVPERQLWLRIQICQHQWLETFL